MLETNFGSINHLFLVLQSPSGCIGAMHIEIKLVEGLDGDSPFRAGVCAYGQGYLQMTHVTKLLIGSGLLLDSQPFLASFCEGSPLRNQRRSR